MYFFVNKEKYCQIFTCPVWFYFTLLVCAYFRNEMERYQLWKSLKRFSILGPMKNDVRFNYVLWKISYFVSFTLLGFVLLIKLRNFVLKVFELKYFKFFNKKLFDFDSFPLIMFTLVIKLRNFHFESRWNTLIFFW